MPMNEDLVRERSRATFDVETVTNLLDGGADQTKRRRQVEQVIQRDPTGVFNNDDNNYIHRTERHVRALAKHVRMVELCRKLGIGDECGGQIVMSKDFPVVLHALADDLPTSLHWIMFVPNIVSLCDSEQQAKWLPLCRDWKMIGCYAQTELGHGSNVRALETTATFQTEAQSGVRGGAFVINSPTLTSAKFWPGTLGRTANHAMVIARLIDGQGKDRGVHNFLVPLRSMKDHSLLPGVKTGDIGPKIGYNVMDNGFASFDNVVIPRRNMAMKFAEVDERGRYRKKHENDAASKIAYITMMQVRAFICNEAGKNLAVACTIATRYSAVRKQGYKENGKDEVQVLDYTTQQHRLFPMIAASYCFFFTGRMVLDKLFSIEAKLQESKPVTKQQVADIHASTSALKSFTTTVAADGMEDLRKACGGHGFLACSGMSELITTYLQNPTVEGDNQMLPQQVVKVLLKLVQTVQQDGDLRGYVDCDSAILVPSLKRILNGDGRKCPASNQKQLLDIDLLLDAFCHRAARLLCQVAGQIQSSIRNGKSFAQAWNSALVQMSRVSIAYAQFLLLRNNKNGLAQAKAGPAETVVLQDLSRLLGLYWMEQRLGDFMEDGYLSERQASWVRKNVLSLLEIIRPNAVSLVDARDFSDFKLKSALGRYDGDVYPAIMEAALKDPLNSKDIGPGYDPHLKRLIAEGVGVYSGTASRL